LKNRKFEVPFLNCRHHTRSSLLRIPPPADILLELSPDIRLTEVFLAKTSEYGAISDRWEVCNLPYDISAFVQILIPSWQNSLVDSPQPIKKIEVGRLHTSPPRLPAPYGAFLALFRCPPGVKYPLPAGQDFESNLSMLKFRGEFHTQ